VLDQPADADLARRLCHRRTGIGADGLIRADTTRTSVVMELWNADGSRAEMSGNGIRCLAQALVDAGRVAEGDVTIATDAGERWVHIGAEYEPGIRTVTVDMGPATGTVDGRTQANVSMGNPHTVLLVDATTCCRTRTPVATSSSSVPVPSPTR
jgi:diaminopimelate epimerase